MIRYLQASYCKPIARPFTSKSHGRSVLAVVQTLKWEPPLRISLPYIIPSGGFHGCGSSPCTLVAWSEQS